MFYLLLYVKNTPVIHFCIKLSLLVIVENTEWLAYSLVDQSFVSLNILFPDL